MKVGEPPCLSVIRPLARGLEEQPLVAEGAVVGCGIGQAMLGIVGVDDVLEDGTGFPEGQAGVGVLDGWGSAVRVDVDEGGLLDVVEAEGFDDVV